MEQSFEGKVEKIEEIIRKIENNEVTLEESVALFEEGMHLIQSCESQLNKTEKKIVSLVETEDGLKEEVFSKEKSDEF